MARGRKTYSRMEKYVFQGVRNVAPAGNSIISWQLDQGEVEAQIKRIMISMGGGGTGKQTCFKLGLFQKQPTVLADFDDETTVISGAIGNQCWHNETITARCPKEWWVGLILINYNGSASEDVCMNVQLNYKVLN